MSSPPSEDPLAAFDFLSDFLPAVDFGEGFRFDQPFNFADFGGDSNGPPSYGGYDNDSCSFSVESSVGRRRRRRRRSRKQRSPNRHYRRESVLLSSWYRSFLRPGMTPGPRGKAHLAGSAINVLAVTAGGARPHVGGCSHGAYLFAETTIPSGELRNLPRRQLGAVDSMGDLEQMRGGHAQLCICVFAVCAANKNGGNSQICKRHHPKGTVPTCSFAYLRICLRAKEITALSLL